MLLLLLSYLNASVFSPIIYNKRTETIRISALLKSAKTLSAEVLRIRVVTSSPRTARKYNLSTYIENKTKNSSVDEA